MEVKLGTELKVGDIVKTNNHNNAPIMKVERVVPEEDTIYFKLIGQNGCHVKWCESIDCLIPFPLHSDEWYKISTTTLRPTKSLTKFRF